MEVTLSWNHCVMGATVPWTTVMGELLWGPVCHGAIASLIHCIIGPVYQGATLIEYMGALFHGDTVSWGHCVMVMPIVLWGLCDTSH